MACMPSQELCHVPDTCLFVLREQCVSSLLRLTFKDTDVRCSDFPYFSAPGASVKALLPIANGSRLMSFTGGSSMWGVSGTSPAHAPDLAHSDSGTGSGTGPLVPVLSPSSANLGRQWTSGTLAYPGRGHLVRPEVTMVFCAGKIQSSMCYWHLTGCTSRVVSCICAAVSFSDLKVPS